jgi:CheY-like chemotaxis protein
VKERIKALIVEDEVLIGLALKIQLEGEGYEICGPVATGEEAIRAAEREQPDLILMDILLAGPMTGLEAAAEIRTQLDIPIVFTSGYAEPALKERALAQKPTAYVSKPVTLTKLKPILLTIAGGPAV